MWPAQVVTERAADLSPDHRPSYLHAALRLASAGERLRLLWLVATRAIAGLCDLALAVAMYSLFLLLQQRQPASRHLWTPRSIPAAALVAMALVLVRAALEIGSVHRVVRYTQELYTSLVIRLTRGYTEMRWERFAASNRSELLNTIVHSAREASSFYHLCIELTASGIVVVAMTVALIYESPVAACGLVATAAVLYIVHRSFIRENVREAGARKEDALRNLQRHLLELFSARREIHAYSSHGFFYRRIHEQTTAVAEETQRLMVLPQVARTLADQGVVLVFLASLVAVALSHGDLQRTLSILVFYFVLSRRLLPLISMISYMSSQLEGSYASLERVNRELSSFDDVRGTISELPRHGLVLELEHVGFRFDAAAEVLRDVCLRQHRGEVIVLHGRSGSGKSTLLHLIAGVSTSHAGAVRVDRASLAYVPQEIVLLDDSIRNNLLFGSEPRRDEELMRALTIASLVDFVASQPTGLATRVGDNGILLSGGQRQRLGLARAVLRGAALLLLDEATAALDPPSEEQVLQNLRAEGIAVLAVTHRSHAAGFADRELHLVEGKLVDVTCLSQVFARDGRQAPTAPA